MSAIGFPLQWRLHVKNETGSSGAIVASFRGVKLSSEGALSYASTGNMTSLFTNSTVANAATLDGDTISNQSNLFLGGDFDVNFISTGGADGSAIVYFQSALSTGDFPDPESGTLALVISSTNWAAESTAGLDRSFEL